MDYELYDELRSIVDAVLKDKDNPAEVIQSLSNVIIHVAEYYVKDDE